MKNKRFTPTVVVLLLILLYVEVAFFRYRFVHPNKSENQLLMDTVEVLLWQ
jgi:hypothetical protein